MIGVFLYPTFLCDVAMAHMITTTEILFLHQTGGVFQGNSFLHQDGGVFDRSPVALSMSQKLLYQFPRWHKTDTTFSCTTDLWY